MRTVVSSRTRRRQLDRLVDRHLLGGGDHDEAGLARVGEDVEHPVGLLRTRPTCTRSLMACGAASWPTMWPLAGGVDDDEVVVALLDLPAELADGEDLPHAGRGGGHEVEHLGQRADAADERQRSCSLRYCERRLGVHRHRPEPGAISRGVKPVGAVSKKRPGRPWRRPRRRGRACRARPPAGEGGGDGGLADAALAGDEDQLRSSRSGGRAHRTSARPATGIRPQCAEPDAALPRAPRPRRRRPWRPARRPGGPCGRSARARRRPARAASRCLSTSVSRSASSGISTSISLGVWVMPIRTSTWCHSSRGR